MIGDTLLVEDKHRRVGRELAARVSGDPGRLVVAIGGESGSGKSEVAHELARALRAAGRLPKVLHLDDYYRTPPTERRAWREQHGIAAVGEEELDWPAVEEHLDAFREGGNATLPCIDLYNDRVDRLTTSFRDIDVLIVEGLYALRAPADLRVFIDLTYRETKKAQIVRGKEKPDEFRMQVLEREHQVVSGHRKLADLLIDREYAII